MILAEKRWPKHKGHVYFEQPLYTNSKCSHDFPFLKKVDQQQKEQSKRLITITFCYKTWFQIASQFFLFSLQLTRRDTKQSKMFVIVSKFENPLKWKFACNFTCKVASGIFFASQFLIKQNCNFVQNYYANKVLLRHFLKYMQALRAFNMLLLFWIVYLFCLQCHFKLKFIL